MSKWIKRIMLGTLLLLLLIVALFYRRDLSNRYVMDKYQTLESQFTNITIKDLNNVDLAIDIHYMDFNSSSNKVIVLIHGAFSSSHTFIPWANALVSAGYRVILPDLPYFGLSGGFGDSITSFRRSASVIHTLLVSLGISSIDIGGNSLGGAVSWFFASEYPLMTESLLLIDALPPTTISNTMPNFIKNDFVASILSKFTPKFLFRPILSTAYGDKSLLTKNTVTRYYDIIRKRGTRKSILTTEMEIEPLRTYDERLLELNLPIYVMWGKKDKWIKIDALDYFILKLSLTESDYIVYDDLGHVPMEENPNTVIDFINFLQSI